MATNFFIPRPGENIEEVTIVNWLVEDGARVEVGDEIIEVETDKAVFPIPANGKGYLHVGPYGAGDVVPILTVVATIGKENESFSPGEEVKAPAEEAEPAPVAETAAGTAEVAASSARPGNGSGSRKAKPAPEGDSKPTPRATPVAQKMAAEMDVDLRELANGGERDRITKQDVARAAGSGEAPAAPAEPRPQAQPAAAPEPKPVSAPPEAKAETPLPEGVSERVPLKGVRGVIARRMAESVQTTARVTLVAEVDATEFVTLRERLKADFAEEWGFAPGYNDLLALIVANALREFPFMNARLSADGEAIERLKAVNLGMAVDTDRGLLVTVIRDADKLGLREFGTEFRALVERARAGKSMPDDLSGGTFTITNLGMYRVDAFTPIMNLPEAAILGVGRIIPKPVVKEDEVVIRKMTTLSLAFDHRLTDGAPAARFLDHMCEVVEEPALMFLTRR